MQSALPPLPFFLLLMHKLKIHQESTPHGLMGELSTAIVQVTQDVDDGARVGQFSQKLDSILAQGAIPVGQAFGIGNPDGSRTLYGFVGAK